MSIMLFFVLAMSEPEYEVEELTLNEFWIHKTFQKNEYDLVVIGDSRVYRGISPKHLAKESGLRVFNLGYSSGGMAEPLFSIAERSIATSVKPVILLGITPHSLTPVGLSNKQLNRLMGEEHPAEIDSESSGMMRWFEPYRPSDYLKPRSDSSKFDEFNHYYRNGWCASHSPKDDPARTLPIYRKNFAGNTVDSAAYESLTKRVKIWTANGISVFAFRVPSTEQMEVLEDSLSGFDASFLKNQLILSGAKWLDFNSKDFRSYDGSHLHFESAIEFSERLGKMIHAELSNQSPREN
ncbi:MAG: hypothetical protein R2813_11730 [Flavobacteriales bacterium]